MTTEQAPARPVTLSTPTELAIRIERVFDAPRERVFAAFTDPELIPQWWGDTTTVDHMDVRTGGTWRFNVRYPNGWETSFSGTYREVVPPERIAQTFEAAHMPGQAHVETTTFEDLGGLTRLTVAMLFDTTEQRDHLLASGAEQGATQTYARLDALLARLAA